MSREVFLKDKNDEQLYFFFNDLANKRKLNKLKHVKLTNGKCMLVVRWFDFKIKKKYKTGMSLKTALIRGLRLIKNIIKKHKLINSSLNGSGLASIVVKNKQTIIIEPQFS